MSRPRPRPDPAFFTELFGRMGEPAIPAALRDRQFLEGIYEHAATAAAEPLAPIVAAGLTPVAAPDDACWLDPEESPALSDRVAKVLPAAPTTVPRVLWTRIRAGMRSHLAERRAQVAVGRSARRRMTVRLAAAGLLCAGLIGILQYDSRFSPGGGTPDRPEIVFRTNPNLAFDDRLIGG